MVRTKNSIRNSSVSAICYGLIMVCSFVARGVFARALGDNLVGVEALFLNVVNMLAIVELGIGTGVIYKLYKPIAEHDDEKIAVLINFFKDTYIKISGLIFVLGLGGAFIVPYFVKQGDYNKLWLSIIFMFYVLDVLSSYLYAHKRALFMADQKNYILVLYHTLGQVLMCVLQIVVLLVFHSFVGYLIIKISCRILENTLIARHYNKYYKHIDLKTKKQLPVAERKDLFANIRALLFHKIGGFTMSSSASIITAWFVNIQTVGYYSNYMMITTGIIVLVTHFFDGIVASFGDLLVTADKKRVNDNFDALYFVNYIMISFCAVTLFVLGKPLILLWIGSQNAVFPTTTLALICIFFFINGMRQSVMLVRNSAGLYRPDQYFPILEAFLNISLSIILAKFWQVNGIVIANILSLFLVPFWTQPIIVHKHILKSSKRRYYFKYIIYFVVTVISAGVTFFITQRFIPIDGFLGLIVKFIVCLIIPNLINVLVFFKTAEFKYLWGLLDELLLKKIFKRKG